MWDLFVQFTETATVLILCSTDPPRVLKQENVMLALPGYTLSCQATGILPIYTALIKNSTVLVNTTNIASITIAEQGNYSCVATNMFGTDTKVISVMFFGKTSFCFKIIILTVPCFKVINQLLPWRPPVYKLGRVFLPRRQDGV